MTQGGATPKAAPVGWVYLDRHRHDGYTIRWRRGDAVAYVLSGKKLGYHRLVGVDQRCRSLRHLNHNATHVLTLTRGSAPR